MPSNALQKSKRKSSKTKSSKSDSGSVHNIQLDSYFPSLPSPLPLKSTLTYSSLPPSPIPGSPVPSDRDAEPHHVFSLWDYLKAELLSSDYDAHQEYKWERVSNFLSVPFAVEKTVLFGAILCLDSFLYMFTILPIRFLLALTRLSTRLFSNKPLPLATTQKADIIRFLLFLVPIALLFPHVDVSKIYHTIRGQETIKLYVIFNALEIADRLLISFGQDLLDSLFSRSTLVQLPRHISLLPLRLGPVVLLLLALIYTICHSLVLVYQLTSLNVAINSYDHSLLTLLVSNQFVEIKGSVFKKFEKDNLFQITCADIVERFQLALMLMIIAFRNLVELAGSEFDGSVLPQSFRWLHGNSITWTILSPVMTVLLSEMLVDWLKHAFITKFNHIRPSVYERYNDVLCRDLVTSPAFTRRGSQKNPSVDHSPLVARRLGFASLPLAVIIVLVTCQAVPFIAPPSSQNWSTLSASAWITTALKWFVLCAAFWFCLVVIKIILGIQLMNYAASRAPGMQTREVEDVVNDYGREPIGESKQEQLYHRELKNLLNREDNTSEKENIRPAPGGGGKGKVRLEDLTRFTMTKRIW
ncbi:DUF747-domain-containing protein [Sistotremastrum suecicum HHB10207 ss-3]|uniref:DUF747-domain-containing protein n=1 Tax=Sistotremastrum suecicum HHB10207 ss-3 TaxID=1314776 RepID=A0A166IE44_9AGAM|nr:DUF747-domain-containing protein [Sistotremastrum suecicum HHB10207 ss-3]